MSRLRRDAVGGPRSPGRFALGVLALVGALSSLAGVVPWLTGPPEVFSYLGTAAVGVLALSVVRPVVAPAPGWLAGGDSASGRDGGRGARPPLSSSAPDGARTGPLALYRAEGCPYCRRVRAFCTDEGISVLLHNHGRRARPSPAGR